MTEEFRIARVTLDVSRKTDSILLGYNVADFDDGKICGNVTASGRTLRVTVDGTKGYVDIDITEAVNKAIRLLFEV